MRRSRSLRTVLAIVISAVFGLVLAAPASAADSAVLVNRVHTSGQSVVPADSGVYDSECNGKPAATHAHFSASKSGADTLLRCGTDTGYGYLKIKTKHGPFNSTTDYRIKDTLLHWTRVKTEGTTNTFFNDSYSGITFRVVVQYNHYSDGFMKGIITAYSSCCYPAVKGQPQHIVATPSRQVFGGQ